MISFNWIGEVIVVESQSVKRSFSLKISHLTADWINKITIMHCQTMKLCDFLRSVYLLCAGAFTKYEDQVMENVRDFYSPQNNRKTEQYLDHRISSSYGICPLQLTKVIDNILNAKRISVLLRLSLKKKQQLTRLFHYRWSKTVNNSSMKSIRHQKGGNWHQNFRFFNIGIWNLTLCFVYRWKKRTNKSYSKLYSTPDYHDKLCEKLTP